MGFFWRLNNPPTTTRRWIFSHYAEIPKDSETKSLTHTSTIVIMFCVAVLMGLLSGRIVTFAALRYQRSNSTPCVEQLLAA